MRAWVGLIVAALVVVASSGAAADGVPRYEKAYCWFKIPDGRGAECGYLFVSENRSRGDSAVVRLPVVTLWAAGQELAPDPIVAIAGGPGQAIGASPAGIELWWDQMAISPWLQRRKVILFEQRGAGLASPSLDCPEANANGLDLLRSSQDGDTAGRLRHEENIACRDRLIAAGRDLTGYNSREMAADLENLRRALGIASWNLYGTSFGTRIALTAMRDYPAGIRAVVLDSVLPPNARFFEAISINQLAVLRALFEACRADAACHRKYPHPEAELERQIRRLNRDPVVVERPDPITNRMVEVPISGVLFLEFITDHLAFGADGPATVPRYIYAWNEPGAAWAEFVADQLLSSYRLGDDFSEGTYYAVNCYEEYPFDDPARLESDWRVYAEWANLTWGGDSDSDSDGEDVCAWLDRPAPAVENEAVTSDIAALLIGGEFDPVTPPAFAHLAARHLANARYVQITGEAHSVSTYHPCAIAVIGEFLDDPRSRPGADCLQDLKRWFD